MTDGVGTSRPAAFPFSLPPGRGLKSAKLAVLSTASRGGLLGALRDSRWRGHRLLILAYHGISRSDEHEWNPELYLPGTALRERFRILRDGGYRVLPLGEAVHRLANGTLPPRAVSLTFDDGTSDFLTEGVPLLKEFGFPATVYVTTYYAATRTPVFRLACRYLLWRARDRVIDGTGLTATEQPLDLRTLDQRDAAVERIDQRLTAGKSRPADELEILALIASRTGVDFTQFINERRLQIMNPDDIAGLPDFVDVQLHTHRHTVPLNADAFRREIEDNRTALADWRPQGRYDHFCYPSGVTNTRFLPWLRDLGIKSAVTCDPGLAAPRTEALMLPRYVDTFRQTRLEFESWLAGGSVLLPRIPRRQRYRPTAAYD